MASPCPCSSSAVTRASPTSKRSGTRSRRTSRSRAPTTSWSRRRATSPRTPHARRLRGCRFKSRRRANKGVGVKGKKGKRIKGRRSSFLLPSSPFSLLPLLEDAQQLGDVALRHVELELYLVALRRELQVVNR